MAKTVNLASFWKTEACGQTVLPDRSILIRQKLVENAEIEKFKCDILSNFQTMCMHYHSGENYSKNVSSKAKFVDKITKNIFD